MIKIQENTTKNPLSLCGYEAGVCWGANVEDKEANKNRGLDCINSGHHRVMEFPQIYITIEGYSARMMRELYTHIAGGPTRLQASTRYIKYGNFDYVIPPSVAKNADALEDYNDIMNEIGNCYARLEKMGVPKEDIANILPLGMESKMVLRTNLRNLIDMSHQRLCTRAYWEFRNFMKELGEALSNYSEEWKIIINNYYVPKCEVCGFCTEKYSCGRRPKKES